MNSSKTIEPFSENDLEFNSAIDLFNTNDWYKAHDAFEEIWHNTNGKERLVIQAILQIAVAEVHLSNGNKKGATMLYGEGLGRLKTIGLPDLGLDLKKLSEVAQKRLKALQQEVSLNGIGYPILLKK